MQARGKLREVSAIVPKKEIRQQGRGSAQRVQEDGRKVQKPLDTRSFTGRKWSLGEEWSEGPAFIP